ncbi:MAG: N-acetylmuramoyl-L-alanine amidase [Bacteroidetes bacterium]|nr:N-acetylmuramoyl-L-alanine amidase [Bacteroidota bacterium]
MKRTGFRVPCSEFLCRTFLCLLVPLSLLAQTNTLRIAFDDGSRDATAGIVTQQGVVHISLIDLARALTLTQFENADTRKLEIKASSYRLVFTEDNSFVTIINPAGRRSIYQLPLPFIRTVGGVYVAPLAAFIPLFRIALDRQATYDAKANTLHLSAAFSPTGFDFSTLRMEPKSNGMLIRIPVNRPLHEFESWLKKDGWLYVTIADAKADVDAINKLKPVGMVKRIVAIQSPTSVQLTFKLSGKIAASEIIKEEPSNNILISLRTPGSEEKLLLEKKQREVQTDIENQRKRWELDVIVLDAGHGGNDLGAVGVTKVREKDISLGIALKLGKLIEKNLKNVKVVYTRKEDSFVELHRRGQIANEAGGKLFISIHCNSLRRKPSPTRGFEVYLLRPGKTDDAVEIAERENAVIELEEGYEQRYQKLTEENFILVAMAQSAYVKASELFADIAQQELEDHTDIPNRGVKQAGFYVLVGASMPNVLVETAYLSNREDERFLRSESGQHKIAEALLAAIKKYKEEYEKLLKEGREVGER